MCSSSFFTWLDSLLSNEEWNHIEKKSLYQNILFQYWMTGFFFFFPKDAFKGFCPLLDVKLVLFWEIPTFYLKKLLELCKEFSSYWEEQEGRLHTNPISLESKNSTNSQKKPQTSPEITRSNQWYSRNT